MTFSALLKNEIIIYYKIVPEFQTRARATAIDIGIELGVDLDADIADLDAADLDADADIADADLVADLDLDSVFPMLWWLQIRGMHDGGVINRIDLPNRDK